MQKEIESQINDVSAPDEIKLSGKIVLNIDRNNSISMGRVCIKGIIEVKRPNVIIDGSNAKIEVNIHDCSASDIALFYIQPSASNVQFKNLNIRVKIAISNNSSRMVALIYNTAYGLKVDNCDIEMKSAHQINMMGVYNDGNFDTHMDTRADNLVISNSVIRVECYADHGQEKECIIYGLYNYLANSVSMQNTFIYVMNKGVSECQKAIGVYTNGRFGRFVGNNIKANGMHNEGIQKEQAHAHGFINEGMHTIITSNNIVGEWGGKCIGLDNGGGYAIVESNKILATHTICGRSIRIRADNCVVRGNVFMSTSRNMRLIEHCSDCCVISGNFMEGLMFKDMCKSGCGIYAIGAGRENIISENIIKNVLNCGIFANKTVGVVSNNKVISYPETIAAADSSNASLSVILSEDSVRSVTLD